MSLCRREPGGRGFRPAQVLLRAETQIPRFAGDDNVIGDDRVIGSDRVRGRRRWLLLRLLHLVRRLVGHRHALLAEGVGLLPKIVRLAKAIGLLPLWAETLPLAGPRLIVSLIQIGSCIQAGLRRCVQQPATVAARVIDELPVFVVILLIEFADGFLLGGAGHANDGSSAELLPRVSETGRTIQPYRTICPSGINRRRSIGILSIWG